MTEKRRWISAAEMLEVLQLIADGCTNGQIARRVGISEDRAKWRVRALCADLGARGRAHAVAIGYRRGYLDLGVCECKPGQASPGVPR